MNMVEPIQFSPLRDEPMARHVSWRAGGKAQRFFVPKDLAVLSSFLRTISRSEPLLFVGLGSNLLVRDGGYRGTVVLMHSAEQRPEMREGLMQIVLMENTLGRVARLLEPLSQIANVRRLSDQELRAAARSILDNRSTRISSKPEALQKVPQEAANDPFLAFSSAYHGSVNSFHDEWSSSPSLVTHS